MIHVLRKFDLIAQAVILCLGLFAVLVSSDYIFYIEAMLGMWQLVSAFVNSFSMYHEGNSYRRRMWIYWSLTIPALLLLFTFNETLMMVSVVGSWGIAVYYWVIYLLFIQHISYRKELSTLVRSR